VAIVRTAIATVVPFHEHVCNRREAAFETHVLRSLRDSETGQQRARNRTLARIRHQRGFAATKLSPTRGRLLLATASTRETAICRAGMTYPAPSCSTIAPGYCGETT